MIRFLKAFSAPSFLFMSLLTRVKPDYWFFRYGRLNSIKGIDQLYFIFSLDCDTESDLEIIDDVHNALLKFNIKPVYAVPGELLKKGANIFQKIALTAGEFINHGFKMHTYFDSTLKEYRSCFFYNQLSKDTIKEDIILGHKSHLEVLNKAPVGFRTPHFGTFQKNKDLKFLYSILRELGYKYSSSTPPLFGLKYGAIYEVNGIKEFPLSGCYDYPTILLDSWGFLAAPNRKFGIEDYIYQFKKIVNFFTMNKIPGILNIYADPLHIFNNNKLHKIFEYIQDAEVIFTIYSEIIKKNYDNLF